MADQAIGKYESLDEIKDEKDRVRRWQREIEAAEKELSEFHRQASEIDKKYKDERKNTERFASFPEEARTNLFWSNCQVLQSTLYTKPPKVDIARRHKDPDDDVARVASTMLERVVNLDLEADVSPFDEAARCGIQDWIIVGLGQLWYRYDAQFAPQLNPDGSPMMDADGKPVENITSETVSTDYVHNRDFVWSPARTWAEVRWVARRVYMTRDAGVKRFGEKFKLVPISEPSKRKRDDSPKAKVKNDIWHRAEVFEIWNLDERNVCWIARGFDQYLDEKPDPLKLDNFFPCPKPAVTNVTTTEFIPRADYVMAQDQYEQVNELSTRIRMLVKACKVVGAYDSKNDGLKRVLNEGVENTMIPVDSWAAFAEKGGIKGAMEFVPIEQIAVVISKLREDFQQLKQEIYEVLGIADIMRGATRATETATAQQIKAQYGSTRLQFKQFDLAQWIKHGQMIKAEIIIKHFQPETIIRLSNIENTLDAPYAQQAVALLKEEGVAKYRLGVEADSMAAIDWAAEREAATALVQGIGAYISAVGPLIAQAPQILPFAIELLKFAVSKFRVSRDVESALDSAIESLKQPQQPPQPTPKEQAEIKDKEAGAFQKVGSGVESLTKAVTNIGQARAHALQASTNSAMMGTNPQAPSSGIVPFNTGNTGAKDNG